MDAARSSDDIRTVRDARIDGLRAEASEAVGYSANTLRTVSQRYRTAYAEELSRWQALRDELDSIERGRPESHGHQNFDDDRGPDVAAAAAAEAGAEDARIRALRSDVDVVGGELGRQQTELAKLEMALRNLESTWLFLERGDSSLVSDGEHVPTGVQMRIIEAQESERSRLAQEVHDGPAQVLSNAIFQVEYIERVIESDPLLARTELRYLRELLRRELGDVRAFISQLRPPLLDQYGLDGALMDTIDRTRTLSGLIITSDLAAPAGLLNDREQTVVLRVTQEALQNVRKHAAAAHVVVSTQLDGAWVLEVRDDGRGFHPDTMAARGGRNFGLQFMRERAELIGARIDIRSRPEGGTVVRLAIPTGPAAGGEEST
jgi:two-component system sensor histidine kinase DegS